MIEYMSDFEKEHFENSDSEEQSAITPEGLNEEELNQISELSKRGYQLLKVNLVKEAEESFNQILDIDSTNNYALVGLGDAARKKHEYRKAIGYYQKCLENHACNNYALFGLADCYK